MRDKEAPFSTFLSFIHSYYHPEARNDNFDALVQAAQDSESANTDMRVFKQELTRLLEGDREGLPQGAVHLAAEYDDFHNDDDFLVWLWQQLYPTEPVPGHQG
ncbi:hypothetical protein AB0I34_30020 [Kribbella sp. NPDC050281]|uniref:hypothetical protein n=1 Tax=Kribbella sp. NPDC050281 TaxID=3155515 RepID=UPI0033FBF87B